ncbi:MAG: pilin [Burkholderiales bacterium]
MSVHPAGRNQRLAATNRGARGFTLLELLVVLGIVAILALMTLPAYLDRNLRAQIEGAMPLAEIAKRPVAAAWALTQTLPADNAAAGIPPADSIVGNHVKSVAVRDGAIMITFGNNAARTLNGKTLTLRPAVVEKYPEVPVAWVCGFAAVPDKMAVMGENRTTVPRGFLPLACLGAGA